ncbi:3-hydroxyacyl-CoA dehydrogenase NAD-binding domain-containing protein [Streptomyces achromogenes]
MRRVGVVGGGQMGAGIAEVCARAGLDMVVCEVNAVAARAAHDRVAASLDRAVRRRRLEKGAARDALARTVFTGSLEDLTDRQLVVEAVVENPEATTEVFAALNVAICASHSCRYFNTASWPRGETRATSTISRSASAATTAAHSCLVICSPSSSHYGVRLVMCTS